MALEPGGRADKFGNEFERLWVAKQLLLLLTGEVKSVLPESLGSDQDGVDVWVTLPDGFREGHQCKSSSGGAGKWTIAAICREGVLSNAKHQLDRSEQHRFVFVSSDPSPILSDLIERTEHCNGDHHAFRDYALTSQAHRSAFVSLCKCWKLDHNKDSEDAYSLLCRLACPLVPRTSELRREVRRLAHWYVIGNADSVVGDLGDAAIERIGNELDCRWIRRFLRSRGHELRDLRGDPRLHESIERLQKRFRQSSEDLLLAGELIPRREAGEAIDALFESTSSTHVVLLHGDAGAGKSGVLYDVVRRLDAISIPYLPLRFDHEVPENSTESYGKTKCALPDSPVISLASYAGNNGALLILDQLDAIRWTRAHSSHAMEVFRELVDEALDTPNIRVIVACRTFDISDDPLICNWKKTKAATEIHVGALDDDEVRRVVEKEGFDFDVFTPRQRTLLSNAQNLSIWLQLGKEGIDRAQFRSTSDLMAKRLAQIRKAISNTGRLSVVELNNALETVVQFMDHNETLTCPKALIASSPDVLSVLQSLHILRETEGRQIVYTHQSYLDYLLAESLAGNIVAGKASVVEWLVANDQSLFRREQLRVLLTQLRECHEPTYLTTIGDLLRHTDIRFHIKDLVLGFLSSVDKPIDPELDLVLEFIQDDEWQDRFVFRVVLQNATWFSAVDDAGLVAKWLSSSAERDVDRALRLMASVHETCGDRIASRLSTYANAAEPWPSRIISCLRYTHVHEDSNELFALRKRMIRSHDIDSDPWWQKLAEASPRRALQLLEIQIENFSRECEVVLRTAGQHETTAWSALHDTNRSYFVSAARQCPVIAWTIASKRLPQVRSLMRQAKRIWGQYPDPFSTEGKVLRDSRRLVTLLAGMLVSSGRQLCSRDPADFERRASAASLTASRSAQAAILRVWGSAGTNNSDRAISWLCSRPIRFRVGSRRESTPFDPARKLLLKHAPVCSQSIFALLEQTILAFDDREAWKDYRRSLKYRDVGTCYPNQVGWAHFVLLSSLPSERLSQKARSRLDEGRRKYARLDRYSFSRARGHGGWVTSPIPDAKLHRISDEHWLRIMSRDWRIRGNRVRPVEGGFLEASHEQFSRALDSAARRNPSRFAVLAKRVPSTPRNSRYLAAILHGIRTLSPPDGMHEHEREDWIPAPDGLVIDVLNHIGYVENSEVALEYCWVVRDRPSVSIDAQVRSHLLRYALDHPDPGAEEIPVFSRSGDGDPDEGVPRFSESALNCTRGVAVTAIAHVLVSQPSLLVPLNKAIDSALIESSTIVRVAYTDICTALLKHDRERAIDLFCQIASNSDDVLLGTHQANNFVAHAIRTHCERLEPVIRRMVASSNIDAAKSGSEWAMHAWLRLGELESLARSLLSGSQIQRQAAVQVVSNTLTDEAIQRGVVQMLKEFLDDSDSEVRRATLRVLSDPRLLQRPEGVGFAANWIDSRAFEEGVDDFARGLRSIECDISPYVDIVLRMCMKVRESAELARKSDSRPNIDIYDVPKVLLRLYDQTKGKTDRTTHNKCLDMWDAMLSATYGGFEKALSDL